MPPFTVPTWLLHCKTRCVRRERRLGDFFVVQEVCCGWFWCVTGLCFISFAILVSCERALGVVVLDCKSLFWNIWKSASFPGELCLSARESFIFLWKNPEHFLWFLKIGTVLFLRILLFCSGFCLEPNVKGFCIQFNLDLILKMWLWVNWWDTYNLLLPGLLPSKAAHGVVTLFRRTYSSYLFLQTYQNLCNSVLVVCNVQQMWHFHPQTAMPLRWNRCWCKIWDENSSTAVENIMLIIMLVSLFMVIFNSNSKKAPMHSQFFVVWFVPLPVSFMFIKF